VYIEKNEREEKSSQGISFLGVFDLLAKKRRSHLIVQITMIDATININPLHIDEDSLLNCATNKRHCVVELPIATEMARQTSTDNVDLFLRSHNKSKTLFKKKCITRYIFPTDRSCPELVIHPKECHE